MCDSGEERRQTSGWGAALVRVGGRAGGAEQVRAGAPFCVVAQRGHPFSEERADPVEPAVAEHGGVRGVGRRRR